MPPHNQHPENGPPEELSPEALLAGAYRDGGEAAYAAEWERQQVAAEIEQQQQRMAELYAAGGEAAIRAFREHEGNTQKATAPHEDHPTAHAAAAGKPHPMRGTTSRPKERVGHKPETPQRPQEKPHQAEQEQPQDVQAEIKKRAELWATRMPRDRMLFKGKLHGSRHYLPYPIAEFEGGSLNTGAAEDKETVFYRKGATAPPWSGVQRAYPKSVYSASEGYDWTVFEHPTEGKEYFNAAFLFAQNPTVDSRPSEAQFVVSIPTKHWNEFARDIVDYPELMDKIWQNEVLEKITAIKESYDRRPKPGVGVFMIDPKLYDPYNLYLTSDSKLFNPHGDRHNNWQFEFKDWEGQKDTPNLVRIVDSLMDPKKPTLNYALKQTGEFYEDGTPKVTTQATESSNEGRSAVTAEDAVGVKSNRAAVFMPKPYRR